MNSIQRLLTPQVVVIVAALTFIPVALNLIAIDFGAPKNPFDPASAAELTKLALVNAMFKRLVGGFVHGFLEWTAVCIAVIGVIAALVHYISARQLYVLVLSIALAAASVIDAFHTLVAVRIIDVVSPMSDAVPFSWAICRVFNGGILLLGGIFFLMRKEEPEGSSEGHGVIIGAFSVATFVAIVILVLYTINSELPKTTFPGAAVTRPYDLLSLIIFVVAGALVYPRFFKKYRTPFAAAVLISFVPQAIAQVYMAFFSSSLFDSAFNMGHYLKCLGYFIPFMGILMEFRLLWEKQSVAQKAVEAASADLEKQVGETRAAQRSLEQQEAAAEQARGALASDFEARVRAVFDEFSKASGGMRDSCSRVRSGTQENRQNVEDMQRILTENSEKIQVIASSTEQLTASANTIRSQIDEAASVSSGAVGDAEKARATMNQLVDSVSRITQVLNLIRDIAEQTNLLALNATIEAARAGEAGKGFAVVATEVKNLADQTGKATGEISTQIENIQQETSNVVDAISALADVIDQINAVAGNVADQIGQQAQASQEIARSVATVAASSQSLSETINNVSERVGTNAETAQTADTLAESMSGLANKLNQSIEGFLSQLKTKTG